MRGFMDRLIPRQSPLEVGKLSAETCRNNVSSYEEEGDGVGCD